MYVSCAILAIHWADSKSLDTGLSIQKLTSCGPTQLLSRESVSPNFVPELAAMHEPLTQEWRLSRLQDALHKAP